MLLNEFNKISDSNIDNIKNKDSTRKMLTFSDITSSKSITRGNLNNNELEINKKCINSTFEEEETFS